MDSKDGNRNQSRGDQTKPYMIRAVVRTGPILRGGTDGNLLKAQPRPNQKSKIGVDFTGTDFNDPKTVFHLEKSEEKLANVLRYSLKENNYYLAANKSGKVTLCKLAHFPREDKYFFRIQNIGRESNSPVTFKSLKTGEYLHCDRDGKAFMKKEATDDNEEPRDRQTWFSLQPRKHQVITRMEHMLFAVNGSYIENTKKEMIREVEVDGNSEDSGRGSSEILEDGYTELPELIVYVSSV